MKTKSTGRHKLCFVVLSFAAACALWHAPQAALAENFFDSGREEFRLKRYHAAKAKFMQAVQQSPGNQKAYLYLGRCLEYLKEPEDAQMTYRACYTVNPFSEDGKRAKQFSMEVAGRLEANEHRAVDSPEQVISSGLLIQRQSLDLQARKLKEANQHAKNRRNNNRRQGYFYTPAELAPSKDEVSDMRFIRDAHGIYDNSIEAARARLHGHKVALNVQDTANALIERLGRKTNSNSPALRALGTNLYVQYFRSISEEEDIPPPPDPPIELRAKQLKFSDIPKTFAGQSKFFKFPTIGTEDLLSAKKTETVEEAIYGEVEKPKPPAPQKSDTTP